MKKLLLLGDSIRLSYQPLVKEKLIEVAEVVGPEDNCRFAKYTLWCIQDWLKEFGKPDIIHWNNGIWDIYHLNEEIGIFTPLEEYKHYISKVLSELRKTGAEIIWASTTAVDDGNGYCRNVDIDRYNKEISDYMLEEKIKINDLNRVIGGNISGYMGEDKLHLNEDGKNACAEAVVKAVMKYIP